MIFERILPNIVDKYSNLYIAHKVITSHPINVSVNILNVLFAFYIHNLIHVNYFTYPKTKVEYPFYMMIGISMCSSFLIDLYRIYLISKAIVQETRLTITNNPLMYAVSKLSTNVACTNLILLSLATLFSVNIHNLPLLVLANMYYYISNKLNISAILILTATIFRAILIGSFISLLGITSLALLRCFI